MNTKNLTINTLILTLILCMVSFTGSSQEHKLSKKERKNARINELKLNYEAIGKLLESKRFTIKLEQQLSVRINSQYNLMEFDYPEWRFYHEQEISFTEKDNRNNTRTVRENQPNLTKGKITDWTRTGNEKKLRYLLQLKILSEGGARITFDVVIESDNTATIYWTGTTYLGKLTVL